MMNQNRMLVGSLPSVTCGITKRETSCIPAMSRFMDNSSGRKVMRNDFEVRAAGHVPHREGLEERPSETESQRIPLGRKSGQKANVRAHRSQRLR